jgi:hypothetical protein
MCAVLSLIARMMGGARARVEKANINNNKMIQEWTHSRLVGCWVQKMTINIYEIQHGLLLRASKALATLIQIKIPIKKTAKSKSQINRPTT